MRIRLMYDNRYCVNGARVIARTSHQPTASITASRRASQCGCSSQLAIVLGGGLCLRGFFTAEPCYCANHRHVKNLRYHKCCHGYPNDCTCGPSHGPTGCCDSKYGDRHATDEFRDMHCTVSVCHRRIGSPLGYGGSYWSTQRSNSTTTGFYQSYDMMWHRSVSESPHHWISA